MSVYLKHYNVVERNLNIEYLKLFRKADMKSPGEKQPLTPRKHHLNL